MPKKPGQPPSPPPPSANRIVIDPVTRIEGHLRIEVEVANGTVTNAWSSGTLFRGLEIILKGRRPEDAWLFTQRLCGVCTYVHASTSVRCVEDALSLDIPDNARVVRNLMMGAQFLHDHIVHFYHLHALDWVDVVSALDADPALTAALTDTAAQSDKDYFSDVKAQLQSLVNSGHLGPFAGGYWGHPAYALSPEENLLLVAHYLQALHQQVRTARMHAIFGGKNPHPQSLIVGGVTCRDDITPSRIAEFRAILDETKHFVDTVYLPDVARLAQKYGAKWATIGGSSNFLTFGEFPEGRSEPDSAFFPRGAIIGGQGVESVNLSEIAEHVNHSWYAGNSALSPSEGLTEPLFTSLSTNDRYSWLKAPRYQDQPMEVGPLARMLVALQSGKAEAGDAVQTFVDQTGVSNLNSVLGRTAARALETKLIADRMYQWIGELNTAGSIRMRWSMPAQAMGVGLNEAPRGALGHWIDIQNGQIANYQMIVPSTWNFGPRCANQLPGPVESALIGTPVADPARPLEVLRTIHSFDPCIACAVHVIDTRSRRTVTVRDI